MPRPPSHDGVAPTADAPAASGSASAVDRAQDAIRQLILDGEYPADRRLKEEELADRVGASRTPVREALLRLQGDGLVEFIANRGAFVCEWSEQDLEEIFELRAQLEGYGAGLAALRATPAQIERLHVLASRMESLAETDTSRAIDELSTLNNEFHRLLLRASGNRRLEALMRSIVQLALVHRTFRRYGPEALRRSMGHHREIIAAVKARDREWAQSVMHSHVHAARAVLFRGSKPPRQAELNSVSPSAAHR